MAEEFKGLNKETLATSIDIKNAMVELDATTSSLNKRLQQSRSYLVDIKDEYNDIKKGSSEISKLQSKVVKSSEGTLAAIKEQNKQLNVVKNLNIQIDNLYTAASVSTGRTQQNLLNQAKNLETARDYASTLASSFNDIANDSAKLDKSTSYLSQISEIVKDIPVLRKFSEPFEKAAEAARQQVINNAKIKAGATDLGKEQSALWAGLKGGGKDLMSSLLKGPVWITALIAAAKFFIDAMFAADERVTNIAKNLSISKDAAADIYSNLTNLKGTLDTELGTTKNIVEAFNDLAGITEFAVIATDKQIDAQIILTKEIGLSKEAALGFQESLVVSNIEATKGVDIVYEQIAAFANQNKIVADGRKIFDQINKTSKLIQINFKGNIPLLTKTVLEANKLGLSLDQVNKVAGSLLDFESSITSELEAELLTGKQLNLENARLYALNNDIAGLTKEIANQGINAANFASMNRIQQEAIAKTLGMSADELGDSLYKQELITKTAGNYTTKLKEEAKVLKDSNDSRKIAKGLALEQQAIAIENGLLQGKTIEEAQRSLTAQEKFNTAVEQAKELFSDLATGGYLDALANGVKSLVTGFRILGGVIDVIIIKPLNALVNTISGILKILAGGINGLFTGNYDLAKEGFSSDLAFAGANIADMAINTAVGVGLDKKYKNMFTKPMLDEQARIDAKEQSTAEDFISRPGQPVQKFRKDDIIIGGTSLSGGGNNDEIKMLLKELINTVKAGGDVYLDSNKVGTAMAMGTYKTQ